MLTLNDRICQKKLSAWVAPYADSFFLFEDSIFSAAVLNRVTDFLATVLKRVPQTKDLHRNGLFSKSKPRILKIVRFCSSL